MRKADIVVPLKSSDPFATPNMPFTPIQDSILSRIEPRAIGSSLVLVALIAAIGYGGWSVLNEIQRVTLAPVEQKPVVLSDLDPVAEAGVSGSALNSGGDREQHCIERKRCAIKFFETCLQMLSPAK